ncbi:hypothetical protein ACGRHY_10140 [Streptomyces sp. HK10]|uniref:hypothetical protein n=1 Tax=Streptomyces sp. HK10 TaxID=3373255 RepID=UPI003747D6A0
MTAEPLPDWFHPPPGGWTADELDDTTGTYVPTGIHHDKLVVPVPFPMDIGLTTLYRAPR